MALFSMTGYGSAEAGNGKVQISLELRSVNARFLDINCKVPQIYNPIERELTQHIRGTLKRGRIDLSVTRREKNPGGSELELNQKLLQRYLEIARGVISSPPGERERLLDQFALRLIAKREVLDCSVSEECSKEEAGLLKEALVEAMDELLDMRMKEGAHLEREIATLVDDLCLTVGDISTQAHKTADLFPKRLRERMARLETPHEIDEGRLLQEIVILAEKTDIAEELARLQSHVEQLREILSQGGGGKKLDFLLQEVLRELNTIASKAQNQKIAILIVNAKANVEKMREQVQNIE